MHAKSIAFNRTYFDFFTKATKADAGMRSKQTIITADPPNAKNGQRDHWPHGPNPLDNFYERGYRPPHKQ